MGRRGERAQSSAAKTGSEEGDGEARAGCWWPGQSMRGATEPWVGTGRAQDPGIRHWRVGMGGAPVFVHTYTGMYTDTHGRVYLGAGGCVHVCVHGYTPV